MRLRSGKLNKGQYERCYTNQVNGGSHDARCRGYRSSQQCLSQPAPGKYRVANIRRRIGKAAQTPWLEFTVKAAAMSPGTKSGFNERRPSQSLLVMTSMKAIFVIIMASSISTRGIRGLPIFFRRCRLCLDYRRSGCAFTASPVTNRTTGVVNEVRG